MNQNNRYVSWTVFSAVIGLIFITIGWSLAAQQHLNNKVDNYSQQLLEIRTQLSQIETDIRWIKMRIQ